MDTSSSASSSDTSLQSSCLRLGTRVRLVSSGGSAVEKHLGLDPEDAA